MIRTLAAGAVLSCSVAGGALRGEDLALRVRATAAGSSAALTIELFRWSPDAERDMVLAALEAPPSTPPPPPPSPPAAPAGGRGRGGRGDSPPSPLAKLTAAIRAAPTAGYIWGEGPTGYAIKYAWRIAPSPGQAAPGEDRVVFVINRRPGAHVLPPSAVPAAAADMEFTVIEARIERNGTARLEVTR